MTEITNDAIIDALLDELAKMQQDILVAKAEAKLTARMLQRLFAELEKQGVAKMAFSSLWKGEKEQAEIHNGIPTLIALDEIQATTGFASNMALEPEKKLENNELYQNKAAGQRELIKNAIMEKLSEVRHE